MRPLKALISKNTIHRAHTDDVLTEIENFTYEDAITPGNVVLISGNGYLISYGGYHEHHGIVLSNVQSYELFNEIDVPHTICTLNKYRKITRWDSLKLKETFPFLNDDVQILKVYRKTKYTENIDTIKDIQNVYKKYNLLPI